MKLKQAIVFAILMENGDGIIGKAPSYILEKLSSCSALSEPECLLDRSNREKLKKYLERWGEIEDEPDESDVNG